MSQAKKPEPIMKAIVSKTAQILILSYFHPLFSLLRELGFQN